MGPLYLRHFEEHIGIHAQLLGVPKGVFTNCKAHVLEDESIGFCGNIAPLQLVLRKWRQTCQGMGLRVTCKWWDDNRKRTSTLGLSAILLMTESEKGNSEDGKWGGTREQEGRIFCHPHFA